MTTIPAPNPTPLKEAAAQASTWTELVKTIDASDGLALVPMETLRRLEGAQRLGVHVLNAIGDRLRKMGIGFLPETLPNRQDRDAILFRYGTPASDLVTAIHTGLSTQSEVVSTYKMLHKLNTVPDMAGEQLATAAKAVFGLLGQSGRSDVMNDMLGDLRI